MLCILHVIFVAGHATCQQIPAQFVTFFSNFAYWWPSDQSLVNVDRPIKICHVKMINCEKVRLPRHTCNFCVSAVSRTESRFFVSRKCFFFICLSRPQDCSDCDLERYHWQSSHNTRGSSYGSGPDFCNFSVSAVSRMESRFFVSRKCFFLHLPLQAAGLLGLRFRAPNGITGRTPTTPGEVPTGMGRTATWYM
jgi:hypothetical protein